MPATSTGAPAKKAHGLRETIAALRQPRVASMLALGFASGLPFLLTGATFGYWLRDEGTTLTAIGFLSWVGLAYTFKVFWAPLMDRAPAPLFGKLGQRRGWALFAQALVALGLVGMAAVGPHGPGGLATIGAFALVVAFASATQDAAVDAWRIEAATDGEELGLFTSAFQLGYRIAILIADAAILFSAKHLGWPASYVLMAGLMGVGVFAALRTPEPTRSSPAGAETPSAETAAIPDTRLRTATALFAVAAIWMWWVTHPVLAAVGGPAYGLPLAALCTIAAALFAAGCGLRLARVAAMAAGVFAVVLASAWLSVHGPVVKGADAARAGLFGLTFAGAFAALAVACLLRVTSVAWIGGAIAGTIIVITAFYSALVGVDLIGGAPVFWPTVYCIAAAALVAPPRIFSAIVGPLINFFREHGSFAAVMLLMIALYRLPEFVIGPVAGPFYSDLGFDKDMVAGIRTTAGLLGTTLGIAFGGVCVLQIGVMRSLLVGGVLQGLGVASYALVAHYGPDLRLFSLVMASDNFGYSFAGVAFVSYMSSLTSIGYTATQYALLSSTYTVFGKVLKGFSGAVVDGFQKTHTLMDSYAIFYAGAGLIGIPALMLCFVIAARDRRIAESVPVPAGP